MRRTHGDDYIQINAIIIINSFQPPHFSKQDNEHEDQQSAELSIYDDNSDNAPLFVVIHSGYLLLRDSAAWLPAINL